MSGPAARDPGQAAEGAEQSQRAGGLAWNRSDRLALTVLLGAWCVFLTCRAATHAMELGRRPVVNHARVESVRQRIDPNTASAASLRRLPLIGPVKAEAIVAYRQAHRAETGRAFTCAKDLEKVHGVGPRIVERAKKYMVPQMTSD